MIIFWKLVIEVLNSTVHLHFALSLCLVLMVAHFSLVIRNIHDFMLFFLTFLELNFNR